MNLALHPIVTALIAVGPAALSYWRRRALLANLDDPALPERLLALQRRNAPVTGIAIGLLLVTAPQRMAWALPLLAFTKMLAAYPLRKALHDETWTVQGYLSFYTRLIVAASGFWLLVGAAPFIATYGGNRDWLIALALAAAAAVWNARYAPLFKTFLGAEPVDVPSIRSRFEALAKDCGLPDITLDQVRVRGGSFTNAVALPSTHYPAVVVTDTLLERFDEDEVVAILAHELAHHEHYTPARLKQANIAAWIVIGVGAVLPTLARLAAAPRSVLLIWPVAIAVALMIRLQQRQKYETESDLRAIALTKDPEALVRALTKLHELARIPRRWDADFERRATHPSLARRIQAIRRASGAQLPSLTEPARFAGRDNAAPITFHDDRLEWQDASSMTHSVQYHSLGELRINARSAPAPELVVVDSLTRRWTIPIQPGDIARVQSVLDIIDVHLGKPTAPAHMPLDRTRVATLVVIVAGMAVNQLAVLFAGVLALITPTAQVAAAAGVGAIAAAGLAWLDRRLWELSELSALLPIALGLAGAVLLGLAIVSRRETSRTPASIRIVATLAVSAVLSWLFVALLGTSGIDIHRNLHEWPSIPVLTVACAAALAFEQSRKVRLGSLGLAVLGCFAAYAGSDNFVDRFVSDPLVAPAPILSVKTQTMSPVGEFTVDFYPSSLSLSPNAAYVALTTEDAHEQSVIHAGRADGPLATFAADESAFLGESELLLLERQSRESVLRLIDLAGAGREAWTLKVPVRWANLSVDRSSRRWRLLGNNGDGGIVRAEGEVGTPAIAQFSWKIPSGVHDLQPLAVSDGHLIAVERRYHDSARIMRALPFPELWSFNRATVLLWHLGNRGASTFAVSDADVSCHTSQAVAEPAVCAAFDGTRTRFFSLHPETQGVIARTSIAGQMYLTGMDDRGWMTGWWDRTAMALHPATGQAIRLGNDAVDVPFQIAVGQSVVAGVFSDGGASVVRIHSMPPHAASTGHAAAPQR